MATNRIGLGIAPIERSVLSDKVVSAITDGLIVGRFAPGDRLVENTLASQLGVSRSPIREALTGLAKAGIVEKTTGHGAIIRRWTQQDLEELFTMRRLLEGQVARLAAELGDGANFAKLESIIRKMSSVGHSTPTTRTVDLDLSFHKTLWALAGNDLLRSVLEDLSTRLRIFLTLERRAQGPQKNAADRHDRLLAAIRSGDPDRAEAAMHDHVTVPSLAKDLGA